MYIHMYLQSRVIAHMTVLFSHIFMVPLLPHVSFLFFSFFFLFFFIFLLFVSFMAEL